MTICPECRHPVNPLARPTLNQRATAFWDRVFDRWFGGPSPARCGAGDLGYTGWGDECTCAHSCHGS